MTERGGREDRSPPTPQIVPQINSFVVRCASDQLSSSVAQLDLTSVLDHVVTHPLFRLWDVSPLHILYSGWIRTLYMIPEWGVQAWHVTRAPRLTIYRLSHNFLCRGQEEREGFLYLSIRGLRKGPGKFLMGSWKLESPGKVSDFLSVKEWEP